MWGALLPPALPSLSFPLLCSPPLPSSTPFPTLFPHLGALRFPTHEAHVQKPSRSIPRSQAMTSPLTVMYLYARRGERERCGALFFLTVLEARGAESAPQQRQHTPSNLNATQGGSSVGKTKGNALEPGASSAHSKRDMHDTNSTGLPRPRHIPRLI